MKMLPLDAFREHKMHAFSAGVPPRTPLTKAHSAPSNPLAGTSE